MQSAGSDWVATAGARYVGADSRPPDLVRVLHVVNGEHYAGAERVQDHLALRLPEQGYEVGFACLKPGRFAAMRQSRKSALHDTLMRGRFDLRWASRLADLVRREGYSMIHTHSPRGIMIGSLAAAMARVPLVHHAHFPTLLEIGPRWLRRVGDAVERLGLRRAAGVIAVSGSVARFLQAHGYAGHRIWLVPNGVPTQGDLLPRRINEGCWVLGTVALLRPRKGVEILLDALALLREQGIPLRLRVVGRFETPEYERAIHQQAIRLGIADIIDWLGFRSDVTSELRQMDVFILPTVVGEGLSMAMLEAMAAGTPVVGTRVDGVTDLIRHGENGLLARPGDPGDLARVVSSICRAQVDAERLRRAAHREQARSYSDRSMAAGVAQVYWEILRCRPVARRTV